MVVSSFRADGVCFFLLDAAKGGGVWSFDGLDMFFPSAFLLVVKDDADSGDAVLLEAAALFDREGFATGVPDSFGLPLPLAFGLTLLPEAVAKKEVKLVCFLPLLPLLLVVRLFLLDFVMVTITIKN